MMAASYVLLGSTACIYSKLFWEAYKAYKYESPAPLVKTKLLRKRW